jgi:hypothetical protein
LQLHVQQPDKLTLFQLSLMLFLLAFMRHAALVLASAAGSTIKVVAFGGSVTQGLHSSFPETWAHEVQRWLQRAFPAVTFELINLARDATDVTPAAVCW